MPWNEDLYVREADTFGLNRPEQFYYDFNLTSRRYSHSNYLSSNGYSGQKFFCDANISVSPVNTDAPALLPGGLHKPADCQPEQKVAVIVPYRNRPQQLAIFLENIHKVLAGQRIYYRIFVLEQSEAGLFNRGFLLNVGFWESLKLDQFTCMVLHDVDQIPKSTLNRYDCVSSPRHLISHEDVRQIENSRYVYTGGVLAISSAHYRQVNGFSNLYWGWGGEDDDFYQRLRSKGHDMLRTNFILAQFKGLKTQHVAQYRLDKVADLLLLTGQFRLKTDGLSDASYKILLYQDYPSYTRLKVNLEYSQSMQMNYILCVNLPLTCVFLAVLLALRYFARISFPPP